MLGVKMRCLGEPIHGRAACVRWIIPSGVGKRLRLRFVGFCDIEVVYRHRRLASLWAGLWHRMQMAQIPSKSFQVKKPCREAELYFATPLKVNEIAIG